jgi:hypothetical protein
MENKPKKGFLIIILLPVLLMMGIITTLVLLPFYPFLHGWVKGDGNQSNSHPFLRFLWATLTMYLKH